LRGAARALASASALAIDTESNNFFRYHIRTSLVQIADPDGRIFLIDPLTLGDLSPLGPLLADPRIRKVFHDAGNDIGDLKRDFAFSFAGIRDTRVAAQFCGRPRLGLDELLRSELGIEHPKPRRFQRCDWSRRPLTPAQERYAAGDVAHLLALWDRLADELRRRGREAWAIEESEGLAESGPSELRSATDFMRIRGAHALAPDQKAVLRELVRLREHLARRNDQSPLMIAGDAGLIALAREQPRDAETLGRIRGLSPRFRERHAQDVLDAIRRGLESTENLPPPRRPQLPREQAARIGRLKSWRASAARETGLEPGLVLPQRLIETMAADPPRNLAELGAHPGIRRWRVEVFGPGILAALRA